jgi:hypothetical protein
LDSIQDRWREPHYEQKHQSRAGDLAPLTGDFLCREVLRERPAYRYHREELSREERVKLALFAAGKGTFDKDYLDSL